MQVGNSFEGSKYQSCESLENEKCGANDIVRMLERLHDVAANSQLVIEILGHVAEYPLILLRPYQLINAPTILVAACFHGDEPAGPWGIVSFLKTYPKEYAGNINLSFLPLVNPTGFKSVTRTNHWGENPNKGFCHTTSGQQELSREGKILMDHFGLIKQLARDGFLSLHEDIEMQQFYLYTFEESDVPGGFTETLRAEEAKFFEPCSDGLVEGAIAKDGIIFRHCDGSFEDFLFHEGVPRTACTETPGLLNINRRVEANTALIDALVRFAKGI